MISPIDGDAVGVGVGRDSVGGDGVGGKGVGGDGVRGTGVGGDGVGGDGVGGKGVGSGVTGDEGQSRTLWHFWLQSVLHRPVVHSSLYKPHVESLPHLLQQQFSAEAEDSVAIDRTTAIACISAS